MGQISDTIFPTLTLFFFFQTVGSKMQVALSFLLVIIASVVQVGNARLGKENIVKEKNDVIERSYAIRQKEAPSGLFKSVLTKAKRRARNEETKKIHAKIHAKINDTVVKNFLKNQDVKNLQYS